MLHERDRPALGDRDRGIAIAAGIFPQHFGPAFGQVVSKPVSGEEPLRLGPSQFGQSAAPTDAVRIKNAIQIIMRFMAMNLLIVRLAL